MPNLAGLARYSQGDTTLSEAKQLLVAQEDHTHTHSASIVWQFVRTSALRTEKVDCGSTTNPIGNG